MIMSGAERPFHDLHEDLRPHLVKRAGRLHLHHPFIIMLDLIPQEHAKANRRYVEKREEIKRAKERHDWSKYIWLHERPYRADALAECVAMGLRGPQYWELVGETWRDSENIHQNRGLWRRIWQAQEPGREHAMTGDDRAALAGLHEKATVWRGTGHRQSIRGLAWTTDRDRGVWFARRFSSLGRPALLATGTVRRADVLAMFLEPESEIVCRRVRIETVEELPAEDRRLNEP
jgi:hypothetical protein